MIKIAYLEISPRQTGKTARMYELARGVIGKGKKVCFVVCNKYMKKEAKLAVPAALVLADGEPFPHDQNPTEFTWFYDEFDWLKSTEVREGGYYATTARFVRKLGDVPIENDVLLQLIQAAGGRFERFYWPFDMGNELAEVRKLHTAEEFRLLYLGECFA